MIDAPFRITVFSACTPFSLSSTLVYDGPNTKSSPAEQLFSSPTFDEDRSRENGRPPNLVYR